MIDLCSLIILSIEDGKTKEISKMSMVGFGLLFLYPVIRWGRLSLFGMVFGFLFVGLSMASNQKFGLADAAVVWAIGIRYGTIKMMAILFYALIFFLCVTAVKNLFGKIVAKDIAFLPFLTAAYFCIVFM